LNEAQRTAVEALDGPVLVLAGAGTGKTRVLTTRLAHLLTLQKAWPGQILAVTFTNKAAKEMKERIGALIGGVVEGMRWLGTFHALSAMILRSHAELVGLKPSFTILDTDDQVRLIKQLLELEGIDDKRWPPRMLAGLLDRWKNKAWTPEQVPEAEDDFANGKGRDLYRQYQERLKALNAVDFGDLLLECLRLLQDNQDVLETYQAKFKYILVDEYQDTNTVQYLWLRLLAQGHKNLCCVGDDDQSIYGWRGAEVENILRFEKDFPGAQIIRLERNYRSTPHILGAASGLIDTNQGRLGKTLWTDLQEGEKIYVRGLWDGEEEARFVSERIEDLQREGQGLSAMAVLVRTAAQMRAFEERFITVGLNYRVIGGPRFYEREEIRDANAYFRVVANPADDLSLDRIMNKPTRGIGKALQQQVHQTARAMGVPLFEAMRELTTSDEIPARARNALMKLQMLFDTWRTEKQKLSHTELAKLILDDSGYTEKLQKDRAPQAATKLDNLKELVDSMEAFDTLEGYLEHIALVMELEQAETGEKVSLMTLHAAKGLEFPTVFLPGWEEGLFPSQRSMDESGEKGLEEERRLAYVGLTRARERAVITYCAMRQIYGRMTPSMPSRFITELPKDHVEIDEGEGFYAGPSRWDAQADFGSGYTTPGWRRAQSAREQGLVGQSRRPTIIEEAAELMATSDPSAAEGFQIGERVFHQKFGYGRVSGIDGNKLTVDFEKAGQKRVIASFVERP